MKYIIIFFLFLSFEGFGQKKNDIYTYIKTRIETLTYEKDISLTLSGCQMKYNYLRTLPYNPDWIQERAFFLSIVNDVLQVDNNGYHLIILKFTSNDVVITDIEKDGSRILVTTTNEIQFAFRKEVEKSEVTKIASLLKKLARQCGAKIVEL